MNERIRELAEQADYNAPGGQWKEYFAELIVRECSSTIAKQSVGHYSDDDWDRGYVYGLRNAIEVITKHFGVIL